MNSSFICRIEFGERFATYSSYLLNLYRMRTLIKMSGINPL